MARHRKLSQTSVIATIDNLAHDGRGVAHLAGKATFISGALPQETVQFQYIRKQKNFDEGIVTEIIEPAPMRITARCPHFGVCGGCNLQHVPAAAQIQLKQDLLLEQLQHIGRVTPEEIASPLQADSWQYRHKARLGVKYVAKKQTVLVGFREQRSHLLAELSRCEVLHPSVGEHILTLREYLSQLASKDKIAQIEVAVGEGQAALVLRNLEPLSPTDQAILIDLAQKHHFYLYLQPAGIDSVKPLHPADLPLDSLSYRLEAENLSFQFAVHDFTQVNPKLNQKMVAQAMAWLAPQSTDKLLDLFCGLGNFTLPLAKRAQSVVGIEGEAQLLQRAQQNAENQGINNVSYYVADLMGDNKQQPWVTMCFDKILLDPPRSGAQEILSDLKLTHRLLYISCNPATLARDAGILVHEKGYRLRKVGVMDMFPHTAHVESMALFERA